MKLLLRYLRQHRRTALAALSITAVHQVLVLLDPLILRRIVDSLGGSLHGDRPFYIRLGLLLLAGVAVSLTAWVAKNYQTYYSHHLSRRVSLQLYSDGIRNSLAMPMGSRAKLRTSEIPSLLQTARQDLDRYLLVVLQSAVAPLVAVVFLVVYAMQIHWSLAVVYLVAVPLLVAATYVLGRQVREMQDRIVAESARLSGSAVEVLRNLELVRSLGLAKQESDRVEVSTTELLKLESRKNMAVRRLSFLHGAGVHSLRLTIVILMLYLVNSHRMTIGQFVAFFLYLYLLLNPIQEMATVLHLHRETEASLNSVEGLLQSGRSTEPVSPWKPGPLRHLAFRSVSFTYPESARPAVSELSFEASRGEFIAFVGPSGAGKSTLLKLLVGLYAPDAGSIQFDGVEPGEADFEALRERIGLVTQDVQLFSGTIRDNLLFVRPQATDSECREVLEKAAAIPLLLRASKGLDTPIGEGGLQLSGGEKQRLAIARALLRKPDFLVFDEATSALDSLTEREIATTLRGLHKTGRIITIAIAHRLSTICDADRIYLLDRGKIAGVGSHAELIAQGGLYCQMWRQQTVASPFALKESSNR
jgi:ATP-binding cassette subfamily B protein